MIQELMNRVLEFFSTKSYGLEEFIQEGNPQDYGDLQRLERTWYALQNRGYFNQKY
jgi:hypothetical protein